MDFYCDTRVLLSPTCKIDYVDMQLNYFDKQLNYVDMRHVNIFIMHVDKNNLHINIIKWHVDMIYLSCRRQKYVNLNFKQNIAKKNVLK